jgi:hypothetical protein
MSCPHCGALTYKEVLKKALDKFRVPPMISGVPSEVTWRTMEITEFDREDLLALVRLLCAQQAANFTLSLEWE